MNATETECPICDRKVQSDMAKCPNCGADLSMSSFADLEEVAIQLSADSPAQPKAKADSMEPTPHPENMVEKVEREAASQKKEEPKPLEEPKKEEKVPAEPVKEEGKHGLGRLFGKKKK